MQELAAERAAMREAGIKYFFLGSLSAAVYLFGFSYLYGFSGSTDFSKIASAFAAAHQRDNTRRDDHDDFGAKMIQRNIHVQSLFDFKTLPS